MCILFFYSNANPAPGGYKLILASNRDEFYARPTAPAASWMDRAPHAYGGMDMEPGREGGTWLGISGRNGVIKVGALLNLTGEPKCPNAIGTVRESNSNPIEKHVHNIGRGPIVSNYITGEQDNNEYSKSLLEDNDRYSAFNFVSVEIRKDSTHILYCSNTPSTLDSCTEDKCHAFGNSPHSVPLEKVKEGQHYFTEIIKEHGNSNTTKKEELVKSCQKLLTNPKKFWPDEELKRRAPNWGNQLSAINVRIAEAGYGSRTHTVILVDEHNNMHFYEDTMASEDPLGEWTSTHLTAKF